MLRLAVIGAGHLGRFHAKLARELDGVELVGVVDPLEEAAGRGWPPNAVPRSFSGSLGTCRPHRRRHRRHATSSHHAVGCRLLRHGIHVLMEKPLASDGRRTATSWSASPSKTVVVLQVGHIERFNPALDQALPYLREPKYIDAVRYSGFTFRSTDIGVVLDLMIHDLDLAMTLAGAAVADVSAFGLAILGRTRGRGTRPAAFCQRSHRRFERIACQLSRPLRKMQVWTSRGHVNIDFATRTAVVAQPSAIVRQRRFDPDQLSLAEKSRLKDRVFEELIPLRRLEAGGVNALLEEQRDFVTAIRTGREPRVTGRQAREVIAVAERILASIAVERWQGRYGRR